MKKTFLAAILWLIIATNIQAQTKTVEKTLILPANKKIDLQLKFGNNIKITAWDKKEASVKVTYEINNGKLNDALLLDFTSDNESARVNVDLDKELMKTGRAEDCPESNRGHTVINNGESSFTCTNIDYEIFVPRDADLKVETINGDIELRGLAGPVDAKSISGFVDMNWSKKKGAVVSLKTITGEVYSDLNIDYTNKKDTAPMVGYELKGKVNGGGAPITLESISNDIYLREQD
ncbi:hypothetical protein ACFSRY_02925 [Pontibacter locisalis]|uniref:Adhesin domain-containing protein n=1 Tax=Pontibacter locisalis TaxID=1719035 RepID=A0ABW5II61_9BACT